jgi:hypothetical protein
MAGDSSLSGGDGARLDAGAVMSPPRTSVWLALDPLAHPVRIDLPGLPAAPTGAQVRAAVADQAGLSVEQAAQLHLLSDGCPVGPDDPCGVDVSVTLRPAGDPVTWAATFQAVATWLTTTAIGQAVAQLAISAAFAAVAKAFEPRAPKAAGDTGPYLIEGAANTARPYAPVPIILGQRRVFPALAAPYRRREGSDGRMWLDCLFDVGVGAFDIEQPRIGDTPLSQIDGALIQTRTKPGDPAITLYDKACFARWLGQEISTNPTGASDWVSAIMPDEVASVEILLGFPAGLHWVDSKGRTRQSDVTFEVRIGPWDGTPDTATPQGAWFIQEATREGFVRARSFATSGRVAVHIRRTNPADDPAAVETAMVLQAAGFQSGPPVTAADAALIAVSIPVSKVAEGQLDAFNVIATSRVRQVGAGGPGSVGGSRNPADLLAALAGAPFSDRPLSDGSIDWSGLSAWRTWCIAKGLNCDLVEDGEASVGDLMTRVAAVGRGRWFWRNGKLSVAFDGEQSNPLQMFTARNVSALSGRLSMPDPLHGLRVRLSRADRDWATDEIEVFAPGFSATTATRFDSADITDQTGLEQVARTAGRILAEGRVRAETIILETDLEGRSLAPLSRFWAASDAGLIGTGSARVAGLVSGGVRLDQLVTVPGGVALGLRLRTADGLFVSIPLQPVATETDTDVLLFDGAPAVSPAVGDLVAVGRRTLEVYDLVVDRIQPLEGGGARITAFAYDAGLAGPDATPAWRSFAPSLLKSPALSPAQIDARTAEARARAAEIASSQLALGLADAVSDGVFNPSEKRDRVPDLLAILAGAPTLSAQANALGASAERIAFDAAIAALNAVLATLTNPVAWHDLSDETVIADPVAFATVSATAFQRRDELIAALGRESARRSEWSGVTGAGRPEDGATRDVVLTSAVNTDQPPSWYWANYLRRVVQELKSSAALGLPATSTPGTLTTYAQEYFSEGSMSQVFESRSGVTYRRFHTSTTTWSAWVEDYSTVRKPAFGEDLLVSPGGMLATNAAYRTADGTAAAIAWQGALATRSDITDGFLGGALANRLAPHPLNTNFLGANTIAYLSGQWVENLQPQEAASNRTETRVAAAIANQAPAATDPTIEAGADRAMPDVRALGSRVGQSLVVNSTFDSGIFAPWLATGSTGVTLGAGFIDVSLPPGSNYLYQDVAVSPIPAGTALLYDVEVILQSGNLADFWFYCDLQDTSGALRFRVSQSAAATPTTNGVAPGAGTADQRYRWQLLITIPAGAPVVRILPYLFSNGSGAVGVRLHHYDVRIASEADRKITTVETGANITETRTAAAIANQGVLATRSTINLAGMETVGTLPVAKADTALRNSEVTPLIDSANLRDASTFPRSMLLENWSSSWAHLTPAAAYVNRLSVSTQGFSNAVVQGQTVLVVPTISVNSVPVLSHIEAIKLRPGRVSRATVVYRRTINTPQNYAYAATRGIGMNAAGDGNASFNQTVWPSQPPVNVWQTVVHEVNHDTFLAEGSVWMRFDFLPNYGGSHDHGIQIADILIEEDVTANQLYADGVQVRARQPQEAGANVTETRVAAAITGQGTGATANNLSQLNSGEGSKLGGIESGATRDVVLTSAVNTDQPPSWYWANYLRRVVQELKSSAALGLPATSVPGTLTTYAQEYFSEGSMSQVFESSSGITYRRFHTSTTTWSAWVEDYSTARKPAFGEDLLVSPGGMLATNAAYRTADGTAAAIAWQGALATRSDITDGFLGGALANRLAPHPLNTNFLGANTIAYLDGQWVQNLRPLEANANVTETRAAAAISGQGALATQSAVTYNSQISGLPSPIQPGNLYLGSINAAFVNGFWPETGPISLASVLPIEAKANVTETRVAAAISGQGSGATANNLSQLNASEGAKLGGIEAGADVTANAQRSIVPQFPVIEIKQGEAGHTGNRTATHTARRGVNTLTGGTWSLPSTNVSGASVTINSSTGTVTLSGVATSGAYTVRYTHTDSIATDLPVNVTYVPTPPSGTVSAKRQLATISNGTSGAGWQTIQSVTLTGCPTGVTSVELIDFAVTAASGDWSGQARIRIGSTVLATTSVQDVAVGGILQIPDWSEIASAIANTASGTVTADIQMQRSSGSGNITSTSGTILVTVIAN